MVAGNTYVRSRSHRQAAHVGRVALPGEESRNLERGERHRTVRACAFALDPALPAPAGTLGLGGSAAFTGGSTTRVCSAPWATLRIGCRAPVCTLWRWRANGGTRQVHRRPRDCLRPGTAPS